MSDDIVDDLKRYAEMSNYPGTMLDAADEITTLRAEVERLRAALEPFAEAARVFDADMIGGTMPRSGPWQSWPRTVKGETHVFELTVEHLRDARAALGEEKKG